MKEEHPFEFIEIRGGHENEVLGLLRLLPENTFRFTRDFRKELKELGEQYCGQLGIYARKEEVMRNRAILEYLGGKR